VPQATAPPRPPVFQDKMPKWIVLLYIAHPVHGHYWNKILSNQRTVFNAYTLLPLSADHIQCLTHSINTQTRTQGKLCVNKLFPDLQHILKKLWV
jgi:hypothetical protein